MLIESLHHNGPSLVRLSFLLGCLRPYSALAGHLAALQRPPKLACLGYQQLKPGFLLRQNALLLHHHPCLPHLEGQEPFDLPKQAHFNGGLLPPHKKCYEVLCAS
ncbi:hypothetical protein V2J09_002723 [Rumex salicifolius]